MVFLEEKERKNGDMSKSYPLLQMCMSRDGFQRVLDLRQEVPPKIGAHHYSKKREKRAIHLPLTSKVGSERRILPENVK